VSGPQTRILVVDDEPGMREGCRRILTAEGYAVETAEDGVAGLELFRQLGDFAAALVDLKMPRMGGIELIEKMHEADPDLVILVITAYATIETAVEATKRGAYSYIPKPFTPDELLLPVRRGLESRSLAIETRRLREEKERHLLEVAFERSKSNTILNCMSDGVLVINREGNLVMQNAAAARMLASRPDVRLPAPLEAAVDSSALRDLLTQVLASTSGPLIASREITLGSCTYMVNVSPVIDPRGEKLGAVAVLHDITALKKLEVAKSMFISLVAHELKNPLAAVESYLNVILSGVAGHDPARDHRMLQRSLERIQALRSLVSELLNLTAIETGNFTLDRTPVELAAVVRAAVEGYRERAEAKGLQVFIEGAETMAGKRVLADHDALLSVFGNLLDNAIKYTPEKRRIGVRLDEDGNYLRASVWDEGIGLSPEEQEHVFEEFYRAKNAYTARVAGTGLGLTLVKRLVELHQGQISVESEPGKGSRFTVSLPRWNGGHQA